MTKRVLFDVLMHVPPCYYYYPFLRRTSDMSLIWLCKYVPDSVIPLWAPLHVCVGLSHHQALF